MPDNDLLLSQILESQRDLGKKIDAFYSDVLTRMDSFALRREVDAFREDVSGHFKSVDRTLEEYKRGRVPEFWKNIVALVLSAVLSAGATHLLDRPAVQAQPQTSAGVSSVRVP